MKVALQKGFPKLKKQLTVMGYDVVDYGDYKYPVDAIIYKGVMMSVVNASDASVQNSVLLVDANGKNAAQISEILQRKLYTPLF